MKILYSVALLATLTVSQTFAESAIVKLQHLENGGGQNAGTVVLQDTEYGLLISPNLKGMDTGIRAMHIHEFGDCSTKDGVVGGAAGGHFDPQNTGQHLGPYQEGHLGDLPPLYVDAQGNAGTPVLAPRVKVKDVRGRALMIHEGGDNFADVPHKLGGGGGRAICGVIPDVN